jgi:enoyl-CoA hydratase
MFRVEQRGAVAVVEMAHGKANAVDMELCRGTVEQFAALQASPARAVVLTGTGSIFSAGVDLLKVLEGGAEYVRPFLKALDDLLEALFLFPKPLVAAVNGHAIAGGCMIACAADRRLMARGNGRVGVPELLVGVGFPVVPLEVLRFAVSPEHFAEMVYSGATYPPEEALRRGLVDELVEPTKLLPRAIAEAERMAAIPAAAFELTKVQMREPAVETMRRRRAQLDARVAEFWTNPATLDAIRSYVERTLKKRG